MTAEERKCWACDGPVEQRVSKEGRVWWYCPVCLAPPDEIVCRPDWAATIRGTALHSVESEMRQQDKKWGTSDHHPSTWLTILVEEVGEIAKAILDNEPPIGSDETSAYLAWLEGISKEATQVAAVATAMLEHLCRMREQAIDMKKARAELEEGRWEAEADVRS